MEYPTMLAKKFEDQVKKTPDKIAVKTETGKYTYRELNRYANRIARQILKVSAAAASETVGLLFEHGVHMIAAILGALKAGKVYVPMSVDYPANRLSYMLSDSESSLLITDKSYASFARDLTGPINIPVLDLHPAPPGETGGDDENPGQEIPGESIAYILYTSGSTGRPKGVVQTHQNADYYNMNWVRVFSITASDRMTLFSSFCHDGSVQDMYSALHSGATLYPLNMKHRESTIDLSGFLNREAITIWHSVPSLFTYFANTLEGNENFPALRFILLGGEPVRQHEVELFKKYFPHSTLANVYGQTESSVNSIGLITGDQRYKKPIIGTPLEETGIFVVDDEGSPVDTLEAGEIVVACKHLSPGYWKNPEAVEKVFGEDETLGRLYWTGDLGCLLADGNIEFLGRKDLQVKIRGFRVEPGEIETQLLKHNKIKEAVVTILEDEKNDKYLSAYIVTADTGEKIAVAELRNFLAEELPDYMVPTFFVFLDQMPLTPNGKIDRKALPKSVEQEKDENYTAPRDEVEEKLAALWAEVLGIEPEKIGIDTDFFQLGGHSLKAVILASKIQREFNVGILLGDILKAPFIRAMAQIARESDKKSFIELENSETKEFYPLSFSQHRLFILHQLNPRSPAYNMPMRVELRLNPGTPQWVVEKAIRILVERHESLRTGFKTAEPGPVQYVADTVDLPFRFVDISTLEKEAKQEKQAKIYHHLADTPFDLEKLPLFRSILVKLEPGVYEFMFNIHHIISDGWSLEILKKEFFQLVENRKIGNPVKLTPLKFQYRDFCLWHRKQLAGSPAAQFWKQKLAGGIPRVQLPADFTEGIESLVGAGYRCMIGKELKTRLLKLAETYRTSLFTVMFSLYIILLSRISGQKDIGCSVIAAGREHLSLQDIVGLFVNSILFKTHVDENELFDTFIQRIRDDLMEIFQYQAYPMEPVFEELQMRYPDIPISFNMLNMQDTTRAQQLDMEAFELYQVDGVRDIKFDLEPYLSEFENGIAMYWVYRRALFEPATIEFIINRYIKLLDFFAQNPGRSLKEYLKEEDEKQTARRFRKRVKN